MMDYSIYNDNTPPRSPLSENTFPDNLLKPFPQIISGKPENVKGNRDVVMMITPSGERVVYPIDLLLALTGRDGRGLILQQQNKRAEEEAAREKQKTHEEQKRQQEFLSSVIRVFETILGQDGLVPLGYPNVPVDTLIINLLNKLKLQACKEPSLSSMDRIKVNLRMVLENIVPHAMINWKEKSIEDIVLEWCGWAAQAVH